MPENEDTPPQHPPLGQDPEQPSAAAPDHAVTRDENPDGAGVADAASPYSGEIIPAAPPVATRTPVPKAALMGAVVALVVAAGAVIAVRSVGPDAPADIARVVPADVVGFVRISVEPSASQRDALRGLLGKLPAAKREEIVRSFDGALSNILPDAKDFQKDVRPWLGSQIGFAAHATTGDPVFVGTLAVRDEAAARAFFQENAKGRSAAWEIVDGIAYIAERPAQIAAFRAAATEATLDTHAGYRRELAAAGGDGIALLWLNGDQIARHADAISGYLGSIRSIPGIDASAGSAVFLLRAESSGIAFVGHQSGGPKAKTKAGLPRLLEASPASVLGALSVFDLKGSFAQLTEMGAGNPLGALTAVLPQIGLDLEKDVLAWLGGELTVVATPLMEFGVIADVTDEAAYKRTIDGLVPMLEPALGMQVTREGADLTAVGDGKAVALRKSGAKVAIAVGSTASSARALAGSLLSGDGKTLGTDAPYRAAIGPPSAQTVFQAYVNLDTITPFLAEVGGDDGASFLEPFRAAAMRVNLTDGGSAFRLVLTLD